MSDVDQRANPDEPDRRRTGDARAGTRTRLERKQQLLDAAEALFASGGYGPTRIADICETAGVAKGLFYWYFENKESLFAELVRSVRQQLRRRRPRRWTTTPIPSPACARAPRPRCASWPSTAASSRSSRSSATTSGSPPLRRAATSTCRMRRAWCGRPSGRAGARRPRSTLLAIGVLGAVAQFSHYHRTGRLKLSIDEAGAFVGQWTIQALAAVPSPTAR